MAEEIALQVVAPGPPIRLDLFVAGALAGRLSRSSVQRLVRQGRVLVAGRPGQAGHRLRAGAQVRVCLPEPTPSPLVPNGIKLACLFEDADIVVVDKPAGLAVHPGAGWTRPTLVQALLGHCADLSGVGGVLRPGIVHRLDAGTSGALVVAKSDAAHRHLAAQFAQRTVGKRYLAVVWGRPPARAEHIDTPYGRHPHRRQAFTGRLSATTTPRRAVTDYRLVGEGAGRAVVAVTLATGRTHQIRVHLAERGCPVVGDGVYGRCRRWPAALPAAAPGALALHAERLRFVHPRSGEAMDFVAPVPPPMAALVRATLARQG